MRVKDARKRIKTSREFKKTAVKVIKLDTQLKRERLGQEKKLAHKADLIRPKTSKSEIRKRKRRMMKSVRKTHRDIKKDIRKGKDVQVPDKALLSRTLEDLESSKKMRRLEKKYSKRKYSK